MSSSWKVINTMGEKMRYVDQDGVNVICEHVDIADPQEERDIQDNLYKQFQDEAQRNRIRFYRTEVKLSDSGGGVTVYYNGKRIEHKKLVMGSLDALVMAIQAALEKQESH